MRLVANLVKGMPIQKAMDTLNFTPRVAAGPIAKTLKSAAANALSHRRYRACAVRRICMSS